MTKVEKLKAVLPKIPEVIPLKKEGPTSLCGPCPWCDGKDRFVYKTDSEKFWCRGCWPKENPGDIIDFHQKQEGLDFDGLVKKHLPDTVKDKPVYRGGKMFAGKYTYFDKNGKPYVLVKKFVRSDGKKDFYPYLRNGNDWMKRTGLGKDFQYIPYNLPGILKAETVYICEGEKDCDTLIKRGIPASCNMGGAEKWQAGLSEYFKGKNVVILPDNDDSGRKHAQKVVSKLYGIAKSIKVVELPELPDKGDITDWIQAGNTIDQLFELVKNTTLWGPPSFTFSAKDLMDMEFPPVKWAVPGILTEGVGILAGKPKMGKSIIALNLGIAVASGDRAFGSINVDRMEVLYLALEDTQRRLKKRLSQMLTCSHGAPEGLHIATTWPKMDNNGLTQLETEIKKYSNLGLVIIDTLKMFRPVNKNSNINIYDVDYEVIAKIKAIADKYCVPILIIHHLRKSSSDDIMDTISGSLGLTGAADTILVLERKTGNADAILHVNGRDVEAAEYALQFDTDLLSWNLLGEARDVQPTEQKQALYDALKNKPGVHMSPKELSETTGLPIQYVKNTLPSLIKEGAIKKEGYGRYTYIEPSTPITVSTDSTVSTPITLDGENNVPVKEYSGVSDVSILLNNNDNSMLSERVPGVIGVPTECDNCRARSKNNNQCHYAATFEGKSGKGIPCDVAIKTCKRIMDETRT